MTQKFAKFLMKVSGWKYATPEDRVIIEKKAIFLAAPHTSILDFVVGYVYASSVGVRFKFMIKEESFKGPAGWILKALGGFPIDRSHPEKMLIGIMRAMQNEETFYLCMCPEGTRKSVHKWKTGYHSIARHTGVPVYAGHYDYKKKTFGHGPIVELTDNAREDTDRLQQIYEDMDLHALHPEGYATK